MNAFLLDISSTTREFDKDIIRVGRFVKGDVEVLVTPERLQKWRDTYLAMQRAGVNVPICDGHNEDKPLGSIDGMDIVSDRLHAKHNFADDDAVQLARRAQNVSVKIVPDVVDGEGVHYGEGIQHVAVTCRPVVNKQSDFVALSFEGEEPKQKKDADMKWLATMLSLPEDACEETLRNAVDALQKQPKPPVELSQEASGALSEAVTAKFSMLTEKGIISKAIADKILLALIGTDEDPRTHCLSASQSNTDRSIALQVCDALLEVDGEVPAAGEKTKAQSKIALAMDADGADDAAKKAADAKRETLEMSIKALPVQYKPEKK